MKVEQFKHANQFHLYDYTHSNYNIDCLQSYDSLVVSIETNSNDYTKTIILGCDWNYSTTTTKHVYDFLEEYGNVYIPYGITNKRLYIQKLIEDGTIKYDSTMI